MPWKYQWAIHLATLANPAKRFRSREEERTNAEQGNRKRADDLDVHADGAHPRVRREYKANLHRASGGDSRTRALGRRGGSEHRRSSLHSQRRGPRNAKLPVPWLSYRARHVDTQHDGGSFRPERWAVQGFWRFNAFSGSCTPLPGHYWNYRSWHRACHRGRLDRAGKEYWPGGVLLFWGWFF